MKKRIGLFVLLVAAVICFSMASCKSGSDSNTDSAVNGTWFDVADPASTIAIKNGAFTISDGATQVLKGTYAASGGTFTGKVTEINSPFLNAFFAFTIPQGWYTKYQLQEAMKAYMKSQGASDSIIDSVLRENMPALDQMYSAITGTYSGSTMSLTYAGERANYNKRN